MSSTCRAALLALTLALGASNAAAQAAPSSGGAPKLAYINSQEILQQAPGRAEAEAQFEREAGAYRQEIQRMGDSLNTLIAAYNKAEVTLSPAAKQTRQSAIRAKEAEYQGREQKLQQRIQQRQMELVRPIMEQINKVIDQIRVDEGYALVLDAGSNAGVVVSADKSLDITEKVVGRLRRAATTAGRPAGAAPASKQTPPGAPVAAPAGVSRPKTPPAR